MTLFGYIWTIIIIYGLFKRDIKLLLFFTLFFMVFQCSNVLVINDSISVGPQVLTSICFIIKSIIHNATRRIVLYRKKDTISNLQNYLLLTIVVVVFVSLKMNGYEWDSFLRVVQLVTYMLTFCCIKQYARQIDETEAYQMIRAIVIIVLIIGFAQWIITSNGFTRSILKPLVYNDDNPNIYYNYSSNFSNKRMYSTFMEPSYMAGFVVGALYYLLCFSNKLMKNVGVVLALVLSIVLSASSTAYVTLIMVGFIFILTTREMSIRTKIIIIVLAFVTGGFFLVEFYDLLDKVIFSKMDSGSAITRMYRNKNAFRVFLSSPLYGGGYKNIRGSSIIFGLLGELGILGLIPFLAFNIVSFIRVFFRLRDKSKYSVGYYGTMYAVLSIFLCLIIACPDLDLCTYWLWLYILALYEG